MLFLIKLNKVKTVSQIACESLFLDKRDAFIGGCKNQHNERSREMYMLFSKYLLTSMFSEAKSYD